MERAGTIEVLPELLLLLSRAQAEIQFVQQVHRYDFRFSHTNQQQKTAKPGTNQRPLTRAIPKDTQELRKELQNVKKLARERAKAITLRIPQLKDCKNHFDAKKEKGKGTMVFICEGQSAAGSITSCRDVNNQAVFVLKGKPLNVWDLKRDVMYKNDEMYNLMQALNVEDNTEGLRYDKVILATDADADGMHIVTF